MDGQRLLKILPPKDHSVLLEFFANWFSNISQNLTSIAVWGRAMMFDPFAKDYQVVL